MGVTVTTYLLVQINYLTPEVRDAKNLLKHIVCCFIFFPVSRCLPTSFKCPCLLPINFEVWKYTFLGNLFQWAIHLCLLRYLTWCPLHVIVPSSPSFYKCTPGLSSSRYWIIPPNLWDYCGANPVVKNKKISIDIDFNVDTCDDYLSSFTYSSCLEKD